MFLSDAASETDRSGDASDSELESDENKEGVTGTQKNKVLFVTVTSADSDIDKCDRMGRSARTVTQQRTFVCAEKKGKVPTLTKKPLSKDGIVNFVCKFIFYIHLTISWPLITF